MKNVKLSFLMLCIGLHGLADAQSRTSAELYYGDSPTTRVAIDPNVRIEDHSVHCECPWMKPHKLQAAAAFVFTRGGSNLNLGASITELPISGPIYQCPREGLWVAARISSPSYAKATLLSGLLKCEPTTAEQGRYFCTATLVGTDSSPDGPTKLVLKNLPLVDLPGCPWGNCYAVTGNFCCAGEQVFVRNGCERAYVQGNLLCNSSRPDEKCRGQGGSGGGGNAGGDRGPGGASASAMGGAQNGTGPENGRSGGTNGSGGATSGNASPSNTGWAAGGTAGSIKGGQTASTGGTGSTRGGGAAASGGNGGSVNTSGNVGGNSKGGGIGGVPTCAGGGSANSYGVASDAPIPQGGGSANSGSANSYGVASDAPLPSRGSSANSANANSYGVASDAPIPQGGANPPGSMRGFGGSTTGANPSR